MTSRRISGSENARLNFLADWAASQLAAPRRRRQLVDRDFIRVGEIGVDEAMHVLDEGLDPSTRFLAGLSEANGPVAGEGLGEDSHERAVPGEEHPEVALMEFAVVDDVQAGEGFAGPGDPRDEADPFAWRVRASSTARMTASVVRVRFSIPE